jgi:hypothetical protein
MNSEEPKYTTILYYTIHHWEGRYGTSGGVRFLPYSQLCDVVVDRRPHDNGTASTCSYAVERTVLMVSIVNIISENNGTHA